MRRLELEHDNVRAALAYCLEDPDPEPGLQLASAVTRFRFSRGWSKEAADSLLEQLARPEAAAPTLARARALAAAAPQVAAATTDLRLAAKLAEESLAIAEAANDDHARADALLTLGWIRIQQDRPDETIELSEQGVALATHAGDEQLQARLLSNLAMAQQDAGVEFRDTLTESVRLYDQVGNRRGLAHAMANLGLEALHDRDLTIGREHLERALSIGRELDDFVLILTTSVNLPLATYLDGDLDAAHAQFLDCLRIARDRFTDSVPPSLLGLALTTANSDPEHAARLHGAADRMLADAGVHHDKFEAGLREAGHQQLRARLGEARFQAELEAGRAEPIAEVLDRELDSAQTRQSE